MGTSEAQAFKLRTAIAAAAFVVAAVASAQSSDGVPQAPDGHPDLSGTWDNGAGIAFVRPRQDGDSICIFGCGSAPPAAGAAAPGAPPPPVGPKYRPEFTARVADLDARQVKEDPVLRKRECRHAEDELPIRRRRMRDASQVVGPFPKHRVRAAAKGLSVEDESFLQEGAEETSDR